MSDIQNYVKYIIKKHETLTDNHLIHIYINRINNRLVLKMKGGYFIFYKLFGSKKNKEWRKCT